MTHDGDSGEEAVGVPPHSNINSHSGESPSPPAHCLLENGIDTWATPTTVKVPWCVTPSTPLLAHLHTDHQGQVKILKKGMPASTNLVSPPSLSLSHVNGQQRQTRRRTDVGSHEQGYPRRLNPCKCKREPRDAKHRNVEAPMNTKASPAPQHLRPTEQGYSGELLTPPLTPRHCHRQSTSGATPTW